VHKTYLGRSNILNKFLKLIQNKEFDIAEELLKSSIFIKLD
jgi:hypothetical protein